MLGLRVWLPLSLGASTAATVVILLGCGEAPPPLPSARPMGISAARKCYRVSMSERPPECQEPNEDPLPPIKANFRIDGVRTPRPTEGTLEVIVESRAFPDIRAPSLNLRLDQLPRPVEFAVDIPAERAECSVFTLHLSAKAGPNVFEGHIDSPCGD
jgi:hypothetical protein